MVIETAQAIGGTFMLCVVYAFLVWADWMSR